jgi:molybdopterin synthase sulfur carrier subunit
MGRAEEKVSIDKENPTISEIWNQVSGEAMPENILVAVNMEYTDINHKLSNGDEVAFFPPVTGG